MVVYDDASFSSQDPLAGSLTKPPSPSKVTRLLSPTKAVTSARAGEKRKFEDVILTPPAPRARRNSSQSPWRLRITVEAENDDAQDGSRKRQGRPTSPRKRVSPQKQAAASARVETLTTTSTVPLNDGESTAQPAKRGRGRPRKSIGSTPARPPTPATTKRGGKGKSDSQAGQSDKSSGLEKRLRTPSESDSELARPDGHQHEHACRDQEVDLVSNCSHSSSIAPSDGLDLHSSARPGANGSFYIAVDSDASLAQSGQARIDAARKSLGTNRKPDSLGVAGRSQEVDGLSHTLQQSNNQSTFKRPQHISDTQSALHTRPSDPTNLHTEFDSIIESEGFSAISLSSVPSAQQRPEVSRTHDHDLIKSQAHVSMTATNSSEWKGMLSENAHYTKKPFSSKQSSGSEPAATQTSSSQPASSSRQADDTAAVKRTSVTSSAIPKLTKSNYTHEDCATPKELSSAGPHVTSRHESRSDPKVNPASRFDGFRDGTRRELRAGLRLGEELLKRQQRTTAEATERSQQQDENHSSGANTPGQSDEETGLVSPGDENDVAANNDETDIWQLEARSSSREEQGSKPSQVPANLPFAKAPSGKVASWERILQNTQTANPGFGTPGVPQTKPGIKRKPIFTPLATSRKSPKRTPSSSPQESSASDEDAADEDDVNSHQTSSQDKAEANNKHVDTEDVGEHSEDDDEEMLVGEGERVDNESEGQFKDHEAMDEDEEDKGDEDDEDDMDVELQSPTRPFNNRTGTLPSQSANDRFVGQENSQRRNSPSSLRSSSSRSSNRSRGNGRRKLRPIIRIGPQTPRPACKPVIPTSTVAGFLRGLVGWVFQMPTINLSWPLTEPQQILGRPVEPASPSPPPGLSTFTPNPFTGPRGEPEPLHVRRPFTESHYENFNRIYNAARAAPHEHPLNPAGPAAKYRGEPIEYNGWQKRLEDWQLAAVDEFLNLLQTAAVDEGSFMRRLTRPLITDTDVLKMALRFWYAQVMRMETGVTDEVIGAWDVSLLHTREKVLQAQWRWKEDHGLL